MTGIATADLVDAVRDRMDELDITWSELARQTGLPTSTVSYLFKKGKRPKMETVRALRRWLKENGDPEGPGEEKIWKSKVVTALRKFKARILDMDARLTKLEVDRSKKET